jgi:hypothetical protein
MLLASYVETCSCKKLALNIAAPLQISPRNLEYHNRVLNKDIA